MPYLAFTKSFLPQCGVCTHPVQVISYSIGHFPMHNGGGRRRVFFSSFLSASYLSVAGGGWARRRAHWSGAERERERSKINRRPPAVLFLILKRALCIKWKRTEYADDSTESCLSQFTKKVVDNTCRARALDFLHTAKPLSAAESTTPSNFV